MTTRRRDRNNMWHWWFAWRPVYVAGYRVFWQYVSRRRSEGRWQYGVGPTGRPILRATRDG